MALANYTDLKQKIIDQSHRNDLDLQIDDFIQLAETEMLANPSGALKMNESEVVATALASTTSRFTELPPGFQMPRSLQIDVGDGTLFVKFKAPGQMKIVTGVGQPSYFTVNANQIEFNIVPDSEYLITSTYVSSFTPLDSDNPVNEVLTKYPNVYLYGCMAQVGSFIVDATIEAFYYQKFFAAIKAANKSEKNIRFGPAPYMTVEGRNP